MLQILHRRSKLNNYQNKVLKPRITDLRIILKNYRDKNFRNHLYIFLICCGISLFIWFLIKMSAEYSADISIRIDYRNLPANKVLKKPYDQLDVRLYGNGSDLFSAKYFSGRKSISINFNQLEPKRSRYFDRYYILSEQLRNQVSQEFDFTHNIISITPDTLYLDFEEITSNALHVDPQIELSFKPQYRQYDSLVITPHTVMVSGPSSIIDTLDRIKTVFKSFSNLDETTESMLELEYPVIHEKVKYSESKVKLLIPVEEYTESNIELEIFGMTDDSGIRIRTFPEKANLTYQIAIKDFNLVKPEMFRLEATYDPEKDAGKNFLKIKVTESPDFVLIKKITPERVEFIIQN